MAERYRGRVEFWEIWNDSDNDFFDSTVEEYIAMQRAASGASTSVAPQEITETGMDTRLGERFQSLTLMKKRTYGAAIGAKG